MSEVKHTPGPWSLNAIGNVESDEVHNIAVVFTAGTKQNWSGSDFATLQHCKANARLISAAPCLLAMLERIRDDQTWRTADNTLWPDLCALISRATGVQQ